MDIVGIIIPTKKRFEEWVKLFGVSNEKYIHLNHIDKSRGRIFSKVLKSKDWYEIDNADEILKEANFRIKNN